MKKALRPQLLHLLIEQKNKYGLSTMLDMDQERCQRWGNTGSCLSRQGTGPKARCLKSLNSGELNNRTRLQQISVSKHN